MTDRDDLAALIHVCLSDRPEDCAGPTWSELDRADAILAAGWRPPVAATTDHQHAWWTDGRGDAQCACGTTITQAYD